MARELTKALLVEDVASPRGVAEAMFASVTRGVPLVRALVESGAVTPEALGRVLSRSDAPVRERVQADPALVSALPPGICERLHVVPLGRDPLSGATVLALADTTDTHAAAEVAYHLGTPFVVVRAPLAALAAALRDLPTPEIAPPTPRTRALLVVAEDDDERRSSLPPRVSHSVPPSPAAAIAAARRRSRDTPPWGTQIPKSTAPSDAPKSGMGSEIPIPLTRRTFTAVSGGTQRPPPLVDPAASPLGEGYELDPDALQAAGAVEERSREIPRAPRVPSEPRIPNVEPPPSTERNVDRLAEVIAELPDARARVRDAGSRDEILARLLTSSERVAERVGLFVVRRGGYLGWSCNEAFGVLASLGEVLLPLDSGNVFDRAVQDGLYLGPLPRDEAHAPLWTVMRDATPDVAIVPVRVQGKVAVVVVADELVDTMVATRHLEELAAAAGDAFARLLRDR